MNRLIVVAPLVLAIAFLQPLLRLGFIDDDAYNSYINGWIGWHGLSWWSFYASVVQLWIHAEGRFMPLNLASVYALFHLTQSEVVAKAVQLVMIGLNVATLAALARRLVGSWTFGLLAAACVPLTLQIRFSLDPIAGFAPLLPVTLEFVLLALLLQLEWHRTANSGYLAGAVAAFSAAALTYEVTYLYLLVHVYLARRRVGAWRRSFWECAAFAAPIVALSALSLGLRHAAHVAGSDTYAIDFAPASYLRTYLIQLMAALPLTFALFDPAQIERSLTTLVARPLVGYGLGLAVAALTYLLLRLRTDGASEIAPSDGYVDAAVVGALLWLLASPLIAASPRWQRELVFGQAYLPVYLEYFGVALIVAVLCSVATRAARGQTVRVVAALLIGLVTALTYQSNRSALAAYQPGFTQGRLALEEAARDGLFADVPAGATLLVDHSYLWDFEPPEPIPNSNSRYLLYMLTGKRLTVASIDAAAALCPALAAMRHCDLRGHNVFAYFSDTPTLPLGERWTRVAAIDGVEMIDAGTPVLTATRARVEGRGGVSTAQSSASMPAAELR